MSPVRCPYTKPIITADQQEVILNGHIQFSEVLENQTVEYGGKHYEIPLIQVANIPISRVVVENGATVQVTGPELTMKRQDEEGTHTDKQHLLILIKPTIIIPKEAAEEASAHASNPTKK